MPYENGKVFHITRNGVKYGASQNDIARALGSTNLDTGSLCLRDNMNIWAMFKPMLHNTPIPYTNAERKARQYGLIPATKNITLPFDGNAVLWGYERPSGWYVLDDFVGENENEGYMHSAPPIAVVEMSRSGNALNTTFKFQGSASNGGIMPSQLTVPNFSPEGQSMANLYPGIVFYLYSPGTGSYQPKSIHTANVTIGSQATIQLQSMINFMGTGNFLALPVFSKTPHVPAESITGGNETVLVAHNAVLSYHFSDYGVGAMLFTRRDIGLNNLNVNVGTGYFKYSGGAIYHNGKPADGGLDDYSWLFLASGGTLVLTPQEDLISNYDKDKRITVTISIKNNSSYGYGLGDWSPVKPYLTNGTALSESTFDNLKATKFDYGICYWRGGVDDDGYYLVLRFNPIRGVWASSTNWWIEYSRELMVMDDQGNEMWNVGSGLSIRTNVTGQTVENVGKSISMIRFGNIISSSGAYNVARGLYAKLVSSDGYSVRYSKEDNEAYMVFESNYNTLSFNVSNQVNPTILRFPADTEAYIDVTVDTETTIGNNELFN